MCNRGEPRNFICLAAVNRGIYQIRRGICQILPRKTLGPNNHQQRTYPSTYFNKLLNPEPTPKPTIPYSGFSGTPTQSRSWILVVSSSVSLVFCGLDLSCSALGATPTDPG